MNAKARVLGLLGLGVVLAAARGPICAATAGLPLSNDDALVLLAARRVLVGELTTTPWNDPYNGSVDAYLLAPLVALAPPRVAFRFYQAAGALLLVAAAGLLARRVAGPAAAWAAALLAAVGSPYTALMAATGTPPNFTLPLLVAVPTWAALRALETGERLRFAAAAGCGLCCGFAVWASPAALPALLGVGSGLLLAGLRPGRGAMPFAVGAALGLAPLVLARALGAAAASPVTAVRPRWLWSDGISDLASALAGLVGLEVPLVIDGPERWPLPPTLAVPLAAALLMLLALGSTTRRAWPLAGWAGAVAGAFALSRRSDATEVRYLFGMLPPLLALAGVGLARAWRRRRALAAALLLAVAVPWTIGHWRLAETWRDPAHAARVWQVPSLGPALAAVADLGARSAYASLQFAGRITLESGETVLASQAWNERFPGHPLRFRDEVDLDPRAAWALSPHLSRGMPRAAGFRERMAEIGGRWREREAGPLVIFYAFSPPYDEARPVPEDAIAVFTEDGDALPPAVLDRDPASAWTAREGLSRGSGIDVRVHPRRRLSALVLSIDLERSPLAVPWACDVDGLVVSQGPAHHGLQWVNGAPRAGRQALLAIPLGDRAAETVRLRFQGSGPPLTLYEVFLYGPDEAERPALGARQAAAALDSARSADWPRAAERFAEAVRLEPHRAAYHANLARARWRAARRRIIDVESLPDGGPELVARR